QHHYALALILYSLGRLQTTTQQFEEAEHNYRQAADVATDLLEQFPAEADYLLELAAIQNAWGRLLTATGSLPAAGQQFRAADQGFRRALEVNADRLDVQIALARFLATCPALQLRDPIQSVQFARQVSEAAPEFADSWSTLGMAYSRAGDWSNALAAF